MGRTQKSEAIVLRSIRFSEADRILHLYTAHRGRIGAIAKGVRKTKSRFGGRLEPLSHVELMLHEGSGELQTITGVELLRSHHETREDGYRLNVGLIGAEAMLRLFGEPEANERAFTALARFLDLLDTAPPVPGARPALDPLVLAFQLKLLWLAGYLPHLTSCVECGSPTTLVGFSARAGGAVCADHARGGAAALARRSRRDRAHALDAACRLGRGGGLGPRPAGRTGRDHDVVRGARRFPTPDGVGLKRALGNGLELDDAKQRIDRREVHRFLSEIAYWALGRPRETQDRLIDEAQRVVGLYDGDRQIGFCRAATDGNSFVYLADVYVLESYRGRGLGEELVREMVDNGPYAELRWLLAYLGHAPALPQARLLRTGLQGARKAFDQERERQRVAPGQAAVRAGEELEMDARGLDARREHLVGGTRSRRARGGTRRRVRRRSRPRAGCAASLDGLSSRASTTGSNRSQRAHTFGSSSPVSRSNGISTEPSSRAEYAAHMAYVFTSSSSSGDESTGRPERKSAQKASNEPS